MMTVVTILKDILPVTIVEAQNGKIAVSKFKEALQECSCGKSGFKLVLMDI
jgi:CheY-like chemotaxis protein